MHRPITYRLASIFDALEQPWEGMRGRRTIGNILVAAFIVTLVVVEINRQFTLPPILENNISTSHFAAVDIAFNLLLIVEVIDLVFGLARSVSRAAGKQIEILSLILLRDSFKGYAAYGEPVVWENIMETGTLPVIAAEAVGALLIFVVLGFYYRIQRHKPITADEQEQAGFVAAKKAIALGLLIVFGITGISAGIAWLNGIERKLFDAFFTVMIFSDILIVLISLRYSSTYHVAFRNSGFAVATVFIRLALIAPPFIDVGLGLGAILFMVGLSASYNNFAPDILEVGEGFTEDEHSTDESPQTTPLGAD